jgi:anti-anti-sigma factor
MRIERRPMSQGTLFELIGRLELGAARHLRRVLAGPASDGGVVTVDISQLESCDAGGVDVLVTLTKRARVASGELLLTSPQADVLRVFEEAGALRDLRFALERDKSPERVQD